MDYHENESDYLEILNDGHKLFIKGFFGDLKYGDHVFKSTEIHFHHPSEHTVLLLLELIIYLFLKKRYLGF